MVMQKKKSSYSSCYEAGNSLFGWGTTNGFQEAILRIFTHIFYSTPFPSTRPIITFLLSLSYATKYCPLFLAKLLLQKGSKWPIKQILSSCWRVKYNRNILFKAYLIILTCQHYCNYLRDYFFYWSIIKYISNLLPLLPLLVF